jgi:hypothetical protein
MFVWLVESSASPNIYFSVKDNPGEKVPKPDPVKHPPPTTRRFYFTEPAVLLGSTYSFTSHVLAQHC